MNTLVITELKRFNYLTSEIDAAYHAAARKLGLSDSAMLILYAVCANGGSCPLSDICRLSGTSKQTINSALRRLEAEGLLYLEASGGRKKQVCLTDAGQEKAKNTVARLIEIENELFGSWTPSERTTYLELTQRYLTSFQERIRKL